MKYIIGLMAIALAGCLFSGDESKPEDGVYGVKSEIGQWYVLDYPEMTMTKCANTLTYGRVKIKETGSYSITRNDTILFKVKSSLQYNIETGKPEGDYLSSGRTEKYIIDDDWCLRKKDPFKPTVSADKFCRD